MYRVYSAINMYSMLIYGTQLLLKLCTICHVIVETATRILSLETYLEGELLCKGGAGNAFYDKFLAERARRQIRLEIMFVHALQPTTTTTAARTTIRLLTHPKSKPHSLEHLKKAVGS